MTRRRSPFSRRTRRACRRRRRLSICRSDGRSANTPARPTSRGCSRCCFPVQRAAEHCAWLKAMVDAGEIYHPLRWTPAGGLPAAHRSSAARGRRRHRPRPRRLASEPPAAAACDRDRRQASRRRASAPRRCSTSAWTSRSTASGLTRSRDRRAARRRQRPAPRSRTLGRGRSRDAARHARRVSRRSRKRPRRTALTFAEAMRLARRRGRRGRRRTAMRRRPTGRASSPVRGSPDARKARGIRRRCARVDPGDALQATLRPYQQAGVRWLHLLPCSVSAPAWPTTWDSARRCRCWRCCWCCKSADGDGPRRAEPARRAGVASRELGGGDRALRAVLNVLVAHPSAMPAAELQALDADRLAGVDLVITSYGTLLSASLADEAVVAAGVLRRGAGDQESRRQTDARRQADSRSGAHRAHRHAGRKPARRSLVDLRLHQSRPARIEQGLHDVHEASRRAVARILTVRCASSCVPTSSASED